MITSPHNTKLKLIRALAGRPKERREAGAFLAEGVRLVEEAFAAEWPFEFALFSAETSNRGKKLVEQLQASGVDVEEVTPEILRTASEMENTQGVLAVLKLANLPLPNLLDFVLIPDQIRDPGNLGTLIRSAAAAGAQAIFIPPETTDPFAPKVVRAGMGAHFRLPVYSLGWDEIRAHLTGLTPFLADSGGQTSCWGADFQQPLALIVGGEAEGASQNAKELAKVIVNIPMPGKIESLNAGVAGAVLMFEVVRQRSEAL
jgi:RNA methyltransferase, TrmH family